jgi:hypoxanthine phosphoribosyltransferase
LDRIQVDDRFFVPYISKDTLEKRIIELADAINKEYWDKKPVFIVVLTGAFRFAATLMEHIHIPCEITFVKYTSYHGTESSGKINRVLGVDFPIEHRNIILLEDIVDTGLTIDFLLSDLNSYHPASVQIATLLLKPDSLKKNISLNYVGFEIPDNFVVGYGLDYNGLGRELNEIYTLQVV